MDDEPLKDTQIIALGEELSSDATESMIGRMVAGKYRVLRRIARGGMGVVYVAEHTALGREVVFKVLSVHLSDDEKAKSRFEREARGLSVLDHPNIVTVHDFGHEDGLTYIVMEYVPGENLSQKIRRKGRIPYDELLPIAVQCIDALAAAHDKRIVHRDIKPSNVVVTQRGGRDDYVKVLDFGLAKLASSSVDITKGNLVGTVSYLAPEVIRGSEATPASDVYALGVMFYYLLTGSKPFAAADEMSVLYQHVNVLPEPLHELVAPGEAPREFLDFIHACMEKDPAKRPQSAGLMREALGELVSMPSISAFSIDSSLALPRYHPPDSSAETIAPKLRETSPSGVVSARRAFPERSSGDISRSQISIERRRKRKRKRVAAIAFATCSVGFAVVAAIGTGQSTRQRLAAEAAVVEAAPAPVEAPTPALATFELYTTPPGSLAVDGADRGRTPAKLELEPGTYALTVTEPGYEAWTETVELAPGASRRVDIQLSRAVETPTPRKSQPAAARAVPDEAPVTAAEAPPASQENAQPAPDAEAVPRIGKPRSSTLLPTDSSGRKLLPVK